MMFAQAFLAALLVGYGSCLLESRTFWGDFDLAWSSQGVTTGTAKFSAWSPKLDGLTGWYRPGHFVGRDSSCTHRCCVKDSANSGYEKPVAGTTFLIKGDVKKPTSYNKIWSNGPTDKGSAWEPVCPTDYYALGYVFTSSDTAPSLDEIRCVKNSNDRLKVTLTYNSYGYTGVTPPLYVYHAAPTKCQDADTCSSIFYAKDSSVNMSATEVFVPQQAHYPAGCGGCKMEGVDVDYEGNDISNTYNETSADVCCAKCSALPNCKSFTFRQSDGGCWLKDAIPAAKVKAGHISGVRLWGCGGYDSGLEYQGSALHVADGGNPSGVTSSDQCCDRCENHPICKAFTFTSNDNNCSLRREKGSTNSNANAESGELAQN